MQRAAKRSRGFEEALQEARSENIGSPGGSQDHWDALKDLGADLADVQKDLSRLQKQMVQIWEALANEQTHRIALGDELRKMLVELGSPSDAHLSPVPASDGSQSPVSVLGQVIDLTVEDPEYPEPWEEAYPAPDREVKPESQVEDGEIWEAGCAALRRSD